MKLKFCVAVVVLISLSGTASADGSRLGKRMLFSDSVAKQQVFMKKKAAIKLYPNPSTNGTVRVVSNTAGKLNFYIFDLEGTLLHQVVLKEKGKHTITNLKKGVYTYDAFYNDEGIDHGQLTVK
jgi:hypothetical protein